MITRKGNAVIFLILASLNLLAAISVLLHVGRQIDREKVIHANSAVLIEIPADAIAKLQGNEVARALSATFNSQHEVAAGVFALYDHLLRDANRLAFTLLFVLAANTVFFFGAAYFQLSTSRRAA